MDLVDRFAESFQPEIVDIGPFAQLLLFHRKSADTFIEKLEAIGSDFTAQNMASPRFAIFRLPQDADRLEQYLRRGATAPHRQQRPTPSLSSTEAQWLSSVHKLSTYERILSGADISAVVRESPVWKLHDGAWHLLFGEVSVAIDNLEKAVGVPLRHDPWLLDQIAPILDRRVIRHFRTEPTRLSTLHSMNLRCSTVVERDFAAFMQGLSFDQRANLIVEISFRDPDFATPKLAEAIDALRLWECRVAIDHLSLRQADPGGIGPGNVDFLKIDLRGIGEVVDGLEPDVPDWMRAFGMDRLIGMFPDTPATLKAALNLGFGIIERRERPPAAGV